MRPRFLDCILLGDSKRMPTIGVLGLDLLAHCLSLLDEDARHALQFSFHRTYRDKESKRVLVLAISLAELPLSKRSGR